MMCTQQYVNAHFLITAKHYTFKTKHTRVLQYLSVSGHVIGLPRTCVGHFRAARGRCGGAQWLHGSGARRLHGGGAWQLHRGSTWRWQRRNLLFWLAAAALAQNEVFFCNKKVYAETYAAKES